MAPVERVNRLWRLYGMYDSTAEVVGAQKGGLDALRLISKAQGELMALRPPDSRDAQILQARFGQLTNLYNAYGEKAPLVTASHWYTTDGDTLRPRQGIVSLILLANAGCGGRCYTEWAALRRLQAKYGDALKTTLVTGTGGFYRNHPSPNPTAESDSIRHYFQDFLKLPAGLSVSEVEFSHRADGRRANVPTPNLRAYAKGRNAALIAPDGTIKLMVDLDTDREKMLDDMIAAIKR